MKVAQSIIELLFFAYFAYFALYSIVFSFAGVIYRRPRGRSQQKGKFAVFIPAYKEDGVIVEIAKRALIQNYPAGYYEVIVIADSLKKETLTNLRALPITVMEVKFKKSTKVKALNSAMKQLKEEYDYAVVLDADNVMDDNFLVVMNELHNEGYHAIQGRRAAKNTNNSYSYLDGLSEEINNHFFCKGSTSLGLSSSLKGSGMSFRYEFFKENLGEMESVGGFDRELELKFLLKNMKVLYAAQAVVFDEKVERPEVFENQRKRWIASQFFYLRKYFSVGVKYLFKGNLTFFNSSILRNIQLPRLLNIGLLTILTVIAIVLNEYLIYPAYLWLVLFGLMTFSILFAIPKEYYSKKLVKAIFSIPFIFFQMIKLLFKMKGANNKFIHTPHSSSLEK